MNTSALKSFAPAVRTQLMEAVTRKLDYVLTADTPDLRQAAAQVSALRREASKDRKGLIERVAYTWFNRLTALRFLDAQEGWHPFKARVLTPATAEETQPELLKLLRSGTLPAELHPHTDLQRLNDLLDGRLPTAIAGAEPQGEVYRHLVLAACRFYHALLPNLFEAINDETEFLLPDDLLTATSVAEGFRTEISDADCAEKGENEKPRANVEILGWLYQFYISEKKAAIMRSDGPVASTDIAPRTQLFTNHWIVRYLVENSLGRLWLLNRPSSLLREHMPYYIESETDSSSEASAKEDFLKISKPEDIKLIDPACGSAHMLTYAFDLLFLIYEEEGYASTEIPALILRHNLHGLEICPRAAQLAELALVFKAREKSRRFFQPEHLVRPHITELKDIRFDEGELAAYFKAFETDANPQSAIRNPQFLKLLHQFEEAKNLGSLIQPCLDERAIADVRRAIEAKDLGGQLFLRETHLKVLRILRQAGALTQRYHCAIANPPYMGGDYFNPGLKYFATKEYKESAGDLFAMFIARLPLLLVDQGYGGLITMETWMFLGSYEKLRKRLLSSKTIESLIHMPYEGRGRTSLGINFGTSAFVFKNHHNPDFKAICVYVRHTDIDDSGAPLVFPVKNSRLSKVSLANLDRLPGSPVAYWLPESAIAAYISSPRVASFASVEVGLQTSNNARFLRYWHEVDNRSIGLRCGDDAEARLSGKKWFPLEKGGDFRKWAGNCQYVVNWLNSGAEIKGFVAARYPYLNGKVDYVVKDRGFFFRRGVSWNKITTGAFSARDNGQGFIFSDAGMKAIADDENERHILAGFLNSKIASYFLDAFSQSMNTEKGSVQKLPLKVAAANTVISAECIDLATKDWDNFETSWDFRDQPLLRPGLKGATLEVSWRDWEVQSTAAIRRMQELETENNRLFIAAYGLDGELQPEVPEAQITLARAEARRDMAAFLSYAVGCMMGRYGLDHPGLILANAGDTLREFLEKVGKSLADLTFTPDEDGIIPVLDGEWFEDDIVARTRDFLRATFGEATLNENLRFIEASLGKPLDKYYLTDFYKDHLQTYKKRPIYWLFQSPKKGFSALVYLHRYTRDTVNTLLNKYLRDYLHKLEARIAHLTHVEDTATKPTEKTAARKERENLQKALKDCQAWERDTLLPLAQARIDLDLDDGVKTNYLKFEGAVQPIPGLAAKED